MKTSIDINTTSLIGYAASLRKAAAELEAIFEEQNANYEMLTLSSVWASNSEVACYSKYKEYSSQYETYVSQLHKMADLLDTTGASYEYLDELIDVEEEEIGTLPTLDGGGN